MFGSQSTSFVPILRPGAVGVACIRVGAGGVIGAHQARVKQLFLLVEGEGWVRSGSGVPIPIKTGQAALWDAGEDHESGSATGLVAIVIEGSDLDPLLPAAS